MVSTVRNMNSLLKPTLYRMNKCFGCLFQLIYSFLSAIMYCVFVEENSPSMMVDPHKQSLVVGEANIARYLARLFMPAYDSSDPIQATLTDTWLDLATHQLLQGNSKEKAAAVRNLNSRLGKSDWLVGSSVSLADIVVWSALQQVGLALNAPANVQKWIRACHNLPEFQLQTLISH